MSCIENWVELFLFLYGFCDKALQFWVILVGFPIQNVNETLVYADHKRM
jgi:hypothetical protein